MKGGKVIIVAEVGSVHDGSLGNAQRLIDAAAQCGADVVKFQTHIAAAETLRFAPMPSYFKGEPRYEYFERTAFSVGQWRVLKDHCDEQGIEFLSSPFSLEAVDVLEEVGVRRYKVASGEVTNIPLLERIAETGKDIFLSSGMSTWAELDEAVKLVCRHHGRLTLFQCTSEYPCPYEDVGLNIMLEMRSRYGLPVGLSDHTLTMFAPLTAVALGATVIEKHFTFSRLMYGSDARHSFEPTEFAQMVEGIRAVEVMLAANVDKDERAASLQEMKDIFQKSIVSTTDIPAGTMITSTMVAAKKPGTGIPARKLQEVVGRFSVVDIPKDTLLREDQFRA